MTIDPADKPVTRKVNTYALAQAYDIRDIAAQHALALKDESAPNLEAKATRARALRDNTSVWTAAIDMTYVLRGRGKPKGVVARNDPSRQAKKPRAPIAPITAA